jgi:hypothetical protein
MNLITFRVTAATPPTSARDRCSKISVGKISIGRSAATELETSTLMAAAATGERVEAAEVEGPGPVNSTPARLRERPPAPQQSPVEERRTIRLPLPETGAAGGREEGEGGKGGGSVESKMTQPSNSVE